MFDTLMKFLGIGVDNTNFEDKSLNNPIMLKKFYGVVLEKKDNELIIGSNSDNKIKMRVLINQKALLPNMVYPSLCDIKHRSINYNKISIRDKIELEFDNELKDNITIPINSCNTYLSIIDLDLKIEE